MDVVNSAQRFADLADRFGATVDAASGRWEAPTPCPGWTVRDVVSHVISSERDFLAGQGVDVGAAPGLDDPAAAWSQHAAVVVAALTDALAGTPYDGYFGPTTVGATVVEFYGWDLAVHGWDVAVATGGSWGVGEEEAVALERASRAWGEALWSEGICAPPLAVADDAPASERLLARLGRDPGWTPPTGSGRQWS